jgi:hypothetical protein
VLVGDVAGSVAGCLRGLAEKGAKRDPLQDLALLQVSLLPVEHAHQRLFQLRACVRVRWCVLYVRTTCGVRTQC